MKFKPLLETTSPRLAKLEGRLAQERKRPERVLKQSMRLCAGGKTRRTHTAKTNTEYARWFWSMCFKEKTTGCWEWMGYRRVNSYGIAVRSGKWWYAHRMSAKLATGRFPSKLVCHICDNRICCNPSHLFSGTEKDNSQDMSRKGRAALSKLRPDQIPEIRKSLEPLKDLAKKFNVSASSIYAIKQRKVWVLA